MVQQIEITLTPKRRGFHLVTSEIMRQLPQLPKTGVINFFCKHTSCGLSINENADPDVRVDMETIFNRLVPENRPEYEHTLEGADDMPAHAKSTLSGVSLTIPITNGRMNMGTWQGNEVNPERRSSGSQFYIVWGQVYNEGQLRQFSKQLKMQKIQTVFNQLAKEHHDEIMQMRRERNRAGLQELQDKLAAEAEKHVQGNGLTDEQLKIYSTIGGTPHLDGQYTVFGEVEEGLDVVEMIQGTATGRADRPVDDIEMRISVVE